MERWHWWPRVHFISQGLALVTYFASQGACISAIMAARLRLGRS